MQELWLLKNEQEESDLKGQHFNSHLSENELYRS